MNRAVAAAAAAMLIASFPLPAAGQGRKADTAQAVSGGGVLPDGWSARADEDRQGQSTLANVKFVPMKQGYHVTLGPATVFYRKKDDGKGPFHTVGTFTQTKAPAHPEGYGLFYSGKDLAGPDQSYTYFLVRGDGQYLIKRRNGKATTVVTSWTAHAGIKAADAKGQATNVLEIDAKRDPNKVVFLVNGQEVHSMAATANEVNGIVGLRVNHNLDVHIDGFDVHR